MRSPSTYLLAFLGAATVTATSFVSFTEQTEPSDTISLTQDTFYNFMENHDLALVNFYSPRCVHCQKFAPNYEAAATELKEENVPLVKVDCLEEFELCKELDIRAYPTLEVFRGTGREEYPGDRRTESYVFPIAAPILTSALSPSPSPPTRC